jgi:hypothetical protein
MKIYVFCDITDISDKNIASIFTVKNKPKGHQPEADNNQHVCVCLKVGEILGGHSKQKACFINIEYGSYPRSEQCSLAWVLINVFVH